VPKNILITGGAGFIGSHFVELLSERYREYTMVVYDVMDYCASSENLGQCRGNDNVTLVKGDIVDYDAVRETLTAFDIDTIVHFAAQSHVDSSFGNSLSFTQNNAFGTHVLLEAARSHGKIGRFVNVSTDEVYGETSVGLSEGLTEESSVLEPTNPYSAAKAAAEMICHAYAYSYKMPIIITRGNNVYGGRQHPEKLIPKMITRIQERDFPLPIHGDGSAVRSYLHVSDVARAFDVILHKGVTGEIYNIGTSVERSVKSVVDDIMRLMKEDDTSTVRVESEVIDYVPDRPFQDRRYFVSSDKLMRLGWTQQIDWDTGLRSTIEWYKQHDWQSYWPSTASTPAK
jgi:UDP-glucose 4,6-dehydratase